MGKPSIWTQMVSWPTIWLLWKTTKSSNACKHVVYFHIGNNYSTSSHYFTTYQRCVFFFQNQPHHILILEKEALGRTLIFKLLISLENRFLGILAYLHLPALGTNLTLTHWVLWEQAILQRCLRLFHRLKYPRYHLHHRKEVLWFHHPPKSFLALAVQSQIYFHDLEPRFNPI